MSGKPRPSSSGVGRNSVAAAAAALAMQAELEPLENAKLEAEIPDELKEEPPLESLFALDKRMNEVEPLNVFEQAIHTEQLETYWNVDAELSPNRLFTILLGFFKDKASRLVEENALLLSRWSRFCKSSHDMAKLYPVFERAQTYLQNEYTDAVDRFERLYEAREAKERMVREQEARAEQERLEFERRGLLPGGRPKTATSDSKSGARPTGEKSKTDAKGKPDAKDSGSTQPAPEPPSSAPGESFEDTVYEVGDMAVFARWLIIQAAHTRDVEVFLSRMKSLVHSDRLQILKDYRMIMNVKPAQGTSESMDMLDGINNFIQDPPTRIPRIEDFMTEFDLLVLHHQIECPISQEDGRPFCYEIDSRFRTAFNEQSLDASLPPYEFVYDDVPGSIGAAASGGGPGSGGGTGPGVGMMKGVVPGAVGDKASLAAIVGLFSKPGYKSPNVPRLRKADWVDGVRIHPHYELWQEQQKDHLLTTKEIDFELRVEHDLLLSNDLDFVISRLRDNAHRTFELSLPSSPDGTTTTRPQSGRSRPNSANNDSSTTRQDPNTLTQQDSVALGGAGPAVPPKDDDQLRLLKPFDAGMHVPDGGRPGVGVTVLEGKKQVFGMILRSNAELRAVEQELTSADPERVVRSAVEPTISTIFAEHEVYAFFQLRHIRLRELRMKLLRQLNFFRSVEKRLTLDTRMTKLRNDLQLTDQAKLERGATGALGTAAMVAHMWHQQDLFEMPDPSITPSSRPGSATSLHKDASAGVDTALTEDTRQIIDGWITVRDFKGTSVIYDAAITDLQHLETNLLKLATIYINNKAGGHEHVSISYMDGLRFRLAERRTEFQDATFLNPTLDRAQLLLELYEAEVKFQFARMELVNVYLEVFEHTSDVQSIDKIAQIITNEMYLRPHMDFEAPYFSRDYAHHTKSLEIHSRTALAITQLMISNHHSWLRRHFLKLDKSITPEEGDDDFAMPVEAEMPLARKIETPLAAGLPLKPDSERHSVIMHHAGVTNEIAEIVPGMEVLIRVHEAARMACVEMRQAIENCMPESKHLAHSVNCAVWKAIHVSFRLMKYSWYEIADFTSWVAYQNAWTTLDQHAFRPPTRARRVVGQLDSDVWLENPLLPDIVLAEQYVPLGQKNAGAAKMLNVPITMWSWLTDPAYANKGKDVIQKVMKMLLFRDRLMFSWVETGRDTGNVWV
ncbi:hypothetical protein HDV00_006315 [Rhizophlyctis rosea]|nr:hypothetical protein HDV00_006315 [Rhizophlyctis rosea]